MGRHHFGPPNDENFNENDCFVETFLILNINMQSFVW